jgi:hypothetical protein
VLAGSNYVLRLTATESGGSTKPAVPPTGTVSFYIDGVLISAAVTLDGEAVLKAVPLPFRLCRTALTAYPHDHSGLFWRL